MIDRIWSGIQTILVINCKAKIKFTTVVNISVGRSEYIYFLKTINYCVCNAKVSTCIKGMSLLTWAVSFTDINTVNSCNSVCIWATYSREHKGV